jgi:hypothetical protein
MKRAVCALVAAAALVAVVRAGAETKREYENRFQMMVEFAVRTNEYVRRHLGDRSLCEYAQEMAAVNAGEAEKMTPPSCYQMLHPHFLLVLENIERSFHFAAQGRLDRYRHHQKIVRKELNLLETFADRQGLRLYMWDLGF